MWWSSASWVRFPSPSFARRSTGSGRSELIGRGMICVADACCAFPEQAPHVGDVVLSDRHQAHGRALLVAGAIAAKGFDSRLRLPALKNVDAARVDQVGGDGEVETARGLTGLFDDEYAVREG